MLMENQTTPDSIDGVDQTRAHEVTTVRQWAAVGAVAISAFAFVTTEFLPVGLLPHVAKDLQVMPGVAGLMVTVPGIIAAISAPGLMLGAGKMNRRQVFLLLTLILLLSNAVSAAAPNFAVMLIGRALLGAALGGFWTLAMAASARLVAPKDAAKAMATILTGVTCATVIGVPFGTFLAELVSWRFSFVVTGGLVALALLAQYLCVPSLPANAALRFADLVQLGRQSHARRSFLMVALVFGAHFTSYTYIAPFLLNKAQMDLSSITWLLLGFGVIGFVSNFVVSAIVPRHLKRSVATMIVLLAGVLIALPLLRHSTIGVTVSLLVWGIAFGAIPLCFSIWVQRATPDHPEAGSALFVGIIQVAIALGSFVGGAVVDRVGVSTDFMLACVLALLGLVVLISFGRGDTQVAQVPVVCRDEV